MGGKGKKKKSASEAGLAVDWEEGKGGGASSDYHFRPLQSFSVFFFPQLRSLVRGYDRTERSIYRQTALEKRIFMPCY